MLSAGCLSRLCKCYRTQDQSPHTKRNCSNWCTIRTCPASTSILCINYFRFRSVPFRSVPFLSVPGFSASPQSTTSLVIVLLGLVEASSRWLVGLAITVVDPFNCHNAERFRMHKKIYIFLHYPRQIKLPVFYTQRVQITRLYLKYNYIATT